MAKKHTIVVQDMEQNEATKKTGRLRQLIDKYWRHKKTMLPLTIVIVLFVLAAIPYTRYLFLGPFVTKTVTVTVVDSQKGKPVSQANVQLDGYTALTDKDGRVQMTSHVGYRHLAVAKQYFKDNASDIEVPMFGGKEEAVSLEATGHLTAVSVINKITGKPVSSALVDAGNGNTVQTDKSGNATIVMPVKDQQLAVKVLVAGYQTFTGQIKQDGQNKFQIIPAGVVYFLSNHSGKIDVVKSNLDGSGRKTVYAGTGNEEAYDTSLLASRDWEYLILKAKRTADKPASLYLINTKTDDVSEVDSGDANFSLIGWSGHTFFYTVDRNAKQYYEGKTQALKSVNAETKQLATLDENDGDGDDWSNRYSQLGNFYIVDDGLAYTETWYASDGYVSLSGEKSEIKLVSPDGSTKKTLESFSADKVSGIYASLYEPQEIYYDVTGTNGKDQFLELDDGGISTITLNQGALNRQYPTFIVSPSGDKVFWREVRDGKNTIFVGDKNADKKQQLADASDFIPYGWLTDNFLLLQKSDSELYVTTPDQLKAGVAPVKISDYYKPRTDYAGYGYGYGGQ